MAGLFDRYGIKEVADVVLYEINSDGTYNPVLYLDSLKISTIEATADQVDARGGKGNPKLITWDYNKEITVALQDALISPKSMAVLFGDGRVDTSNTDWKSIKTKYYTATTSDETTLPTTMEYITPNGDKITSTKVTFYDEDGEKVTELDAGVQYLCEMELPVTDLREITVNGNSFPGTYRLVGDTFIRNEITGKDEMYQFEIFRAKMASEATITMEAEGDQIEKGSLLKKSRELLETAA